MTLFLVLLALSVTYLIIIWRLDVYEREPWWAVALCFASGAISAGVLVAFVSSATIGLTVLRGAIFEEVTRALALGLALLVIWRQGRARAWLTLDEPMDGVVYGTAAGLGFAIGRLFVLELRVGGGTTGLLEPPLWDQITAEVLVGLTDGLLGAIIGVGIVLGIRSRPPLRRAACWTLGLLAAIGANAGMRFWRDAQALEGTSTLPLTLAALVLPLAVLALVVAVGSSYGKRPLRELHERGVISDSELELHQRHMRRLLRYGGALARGDVTRWEQLRKLLNSQARLASLEDRASRDRGIEHVAGATEEVRQLEDAVCKARAHLYDTDVDQAETAG